MKEVLKLIVVLTVISAASGGLMALVDTRTREPIRRAIQAEKEAAIKNVMTECDNNPNVNTVTVEHASQSWIFYVGRKDGEFAGAAFETSSPEGYGGDVNIMAGVAADGSVHAIEILPPKKETPGLGAKIEKDDFLGQFRGKSIGKTSWRVTKDGGDIHEITAATISSRAVVNSLKAGLDAFTAHESLIRNTGMEGAE